jgi:hypothetical protein
VPPYLTANPVVSNGSVEFTANELVRGLDDASVSVLDTTDSDHPVSMPGTWSCTNNTNKAVDCATRPFRFATYTLDGATWTNNHIYEAVIDLGPSESLVDLAGNPCVGYGCEPGFQYFD